MDSTVIQYIGIAVLFLIALIYVFRRTKRAITGDKGCAKGCDCASKPIENKTRQVF